MFTDSYSSAGSVSPTLGIGGPGLILRSPKSHEYLQIIMSVDFVVFLSVCDWIQVSYRNKNYLSHVMRLWYFSSSVNSFFKRACAAIQWAKSLIFGGTLFLLTYFMCANSEGCGKTVQMHRLAWAFAGHICDHNLMSWLIWNSCHFVPLLKGRGNILFLVPILQGGVSHIL